MASNRFKIGIFASNCSGGIACTTVPERWEPTWENNLEIAQMADEANLEFMLPLGRWAGYGGKQTTTARHSRHSLGHLAC